MCKHVSTQEQTDRHEKEKKTVKSQSQFLPPQNANRNTSYPKYQAEEEEDGLGRDDSAVHGACREGCEGIEESLLRSQLFCFYLVDAPSCCVDHKFPKSACLRGPWSHGHMLRGGDWWIRSGPAAFQLHCGMEAAPGQKLLEVIKRRNVLKITTYYLKYNGWVLLCRVVHFKYCSHTVSVGCVPTLLERLSSYRYTVSAVHCGYCSSFNLHVTTQVSKTLT